MLSEKVKAATRTDHEYVEALLMHQLQHMQTINDYATVLKMFYNYFSGAERNIQEQLKPPFLPDIRERQRMQLLINDLEVIGSQPTLEPGVPQPAITSKASAFGALYVLEGSTLGGKYIANMLKNHTRVVIPENALQFFSGYKQQTGEKWKSFLEVFNRQSEEGEIIGAAKQTFHSLKIWAEKYLSHAAND